ncbi:putative ribonuclease H-like domain-containing protein [Tanacetum coccineum]
MSEADPIPPTSSVTALRIPMIKKGEYDLWSMKMRQYIAITDHILWDIITNGDQPTTDPHPRQCLHQKLRLAANARRNNEKALNILLSAIPDRHLLSFHDAVDAKSLWIAIKARFGGNEASKKMQKNSFETTIQTICLVGVVLLSTEVKGSTLKQSTAEPTNIPKGYTQAASSKVPTAPNYASHSDEIICSFFSQQASMPTTHDDEDLLQIDEDAMEEIDIRWQVAMITARIRKFMRKTGRPIDLKPKNGITFDKSKIECFNCQKLGHFARECRFAKYQENRANGRQEKRIVAIEDPNSKALVATDNNEDIDWTKEFDAEPVTFAMMALTELEEDDWSMEIDAEHVHFGQDGLGDFDWSNIADDAPVSLALMATNSEMDVKSAFLYGKIEEEVYICQPSGFKDPEFPDKVYKVEKALYVYIKLLEPGIKKCYSTVYVYVDDIIFRSTKKELCTDFEKLMHKNFQMSSIGELTFFLGLQVTQKDDGIFISQDNYMDEILKKFGFFNVKTTSSPMETSNHYSRCKHFKSHPKVSHLHAVKRIFRYLKGELSISWKKIDFMVVTKMVCKTETMSLLYENIQYEVFCDLNDGVWGKVCEVWQNVEDICRQVNEELGFLDDEKLRK